tara:strand:+ start:14 stop:721 length:708 start_codon:yes stop_codon:yes gene_type:complete
LDATDVRGLLGLLLGDGSLVPYRTPGGGYIQLTLTAGASESAFLEEKVDEFRTFIKTKAQIVPYRTTPRANGKTTPILRFRVSTNKLRPIYNLLYPIGERQITHTTLDLLGAQAAAWLWAEGVKIRQDQSALLGRVGSTSEETLLIASWLEMLTGAKSKLEDNYVKPRLSFSPEDSVKIQEALKQYAPHTRKHLFQGDQWNVSAIRSSRTELQFRQRSDQSQGEEETPLVRSIQI